jgi:TolB protein
MYWAWMADDRMLVHAGGEGPDAYLGEVGLDGVERRRAAVVAGRFQAPAVSGDGIGRAYVVSTDDPEPENRSAVIVVEDRDGNIRRVAVRGPTALGWGPGASGLAFIAPRGHTALPIGSLELLDVAATLPRRLVDEGVVAFFWSPEGASIAALAVAGDGPRQVASIDARLPDAGAQPVADEDGTLRLLIVDAGDGMVRLDRPVRLSDTFIRQLLPYFDQYALSHRLWSSDGSALVLPLVDDEGHSRITVVPVDDSPPDEIADGEIAFWGP